MLGQLALKPSVWPIQIPNVFEQQSLQGGVRIAGILAPVHSLVFLIARYQQSVAFFNMGAADVMAL